MIRVVIVDDSALMREVLTEILSSDPNIEVVATAEEPFDAREKIKQFNPDVITLDIEMPKMDGIQFLKKIMTLRPMPVVMISTLTSKGSNKTLEALEIGAVDYIGKPVRGGVVGDLRHQAAEIIKKVKCAALSNVKARVKPINLNTLPFTPSTKAFNRIIAIGSSTGGVEALREIITRLPSNCPPVVIAQHMPAKFTKSFANRLNDCCAVRVWEATNNQEIKAGNVYITPGTHNMAIKAFGNKYKCILLDHSETKGARPSVDVMFESVAENAGSNAIGVILTGMGDDGAKGMQKMRKQGSYNIGQNEASCVVYGMPKVAQELGVVDEEVSLDNVAETILNKCNK